MGVDTWVTKARSLLSAVRPYIPPLFNARAPLANDPWRAFAKERFLAYATSFTNYGKLLPRRRTMTGFVHGIGMRIELDKVAKVSAKIPAGVAGKMCAYSDNMLVDMVTIGASVLPDIGDQDFDARFFLRGTDSKVSESLLSADVRQALMQFPAGISLDYDAGTLSLTWSGDGVIDALAVDAACHIIITACSARPTTGVYR